MARFPNLHMPGSSLCDILTHRINDATVNIMAAPPIEVPTAAPEAVRLTLLWVTPQPTHRNDPFETRFDGVREPPPLSLSGFYMISTYGTEATEEPTQAYNLLGRVLRIFDSEPVIRLPDVPSGAGGEGELGIVLVPMAADLMEKIYAPLQMRHRPWALFEVSPIQLISEAPEKDADFIVQPGGINLQDIQAASPPSIRRIVPGRIGPGGQVRLNTHRRGVLEQILINEARVPLADITETADGETIFFTLPPVSQGAVDVSIQVGGLFSETVTLQVVPPDVPTVNSPSPPMHSLGANLGLGGQSLAAVEEVYFWPESGIASPADVHIVAVTDSGPNHVTMTAAELSGAGITPGHYRISLRSVPRIFTPFVQLELLP